MLNLALEKSKDMNIKKVLITCSKENIASAKTIIYNGGILENEISKGERITQRYWISLFK
ncbi:TPA: acetyltransferase [Clostridium botulinum]|nr:acetyltransferase [Clostridium botulinum]